ncbi:MAG: cell division protein FtsA [Candidatus Marinimicrobia bacterium]|nr:cell division protein FtsA [Candidatus Neomarinimicrobiota bacterium]
MKNIVSALDIGSENIKAVIAEVSDEYKPRILTSVMEESSGIRDGEIVDMEKASRSIKNTIDQIKKISEFEPGEYYVSITGNHIKGIDTNGLISTTKKDSSGVEEPGTISKYHIEKVNEKVEENSMACPLPVDRDILHIFPKEYIVDNRRGIINPEDLTGRRLEIRAHLTIYSTTAARNLIRCLKKSGVKVKEFVLHSLASAYSTLSEDEKEHGTILIDVGANTTDVIYYSQGKVQYTGFVPQGGKNVTRDIARMLQIGSKTAENLKIENGLAIKKMAPGNKILEIEGLSGYDPFEIEQSRLAEYIEARMREIFQEAKVEANKINTPRVSNPPVVLTGGGALIKGSARLCEDVFDTSCKVARPVNFQGQVEDINSPIFSAATGLINYARKNTSKNKAQILLQKAPVNLSFLEKIKNFIDRIM